MIKKILLMVLFIAPLGLAAQKFATFDYATVMQAMPETKKAQTELESLNNQYRTELQNMQKEIQTKMEKYEAEINDKTPENIRTRRAQEIQEMQQRLQQAYEDNTKNFQDEETKKMQPIIQKVIDAVNAVSKEGNYVYIIDKAFSQKAGIFVNTALNEDVTNKVLAKLGLSASAATPATPSTMK